jgi:hypothetical protein
VVVEGAVHAALGVLGRAEVGDPDVDALRAEAGDGGQLWRDVVDVRGHHQRRHQEQRRARRLGALGAVVVAQRQHAFGQRDVEGRTVGLAEAPLRQQLPGVLGAPAPRPKPATHLLDRTAPG